MTTLIIKLEIDNASFAAPNLYGEIDSCLAQIAVKMSNGDDTGTIKDYNGNTVGNYTTEV